VKQKTRAAIKARPTTPPTTAPAIVPALAEELEVEPVCAVGDGPGVDVDELVALEVLVLVELGTFVDSAPPAVPIRNYNETVRSHAPRAACAAGERNPSLACSNLRRCRQNYDPSVPIHQDMPNEALSWKEGC
jgi:hypothetical protein